MRRIRAVRPDETPPEPEIVFFCRHDDEPLAGASDDESETVGRARPGEEPTLFDIATPHHVTRIR